mmetsp:Transcript_3358/g.4422  ORF Transcript_3358/g.4422 Transcript_3358/m.4422 type:complete len:140 (-) Transcript_3358:482-901(-)
MMKHLKSELKKQKKLFLENDWSAIHTPLLTSHTSPHTPRYFSKEEHHHDNDDFDLVTISPDEWAQITSESFEVDTQIVYDTVIKGRWSVKNGRCHFVQVTSTDGISSSAHLSDDKAHNSMPRDDELAAFKRSAALDDDR